MSDLIKWINANKKEVHSIELATIFHHSITHIHPFFDGNGRTARLAMNILLMQNGYPLVIILRMIEKNIMMCLKRQIKENLSH